MPSAIAKNTAPNLLTIARAEIPPVSEIRDTAEYSARYDKRKNYVQTPFFTAEKEQPDIRAQKKPCAVFISRHNEPEENEKDACYKNEYGIYLFFERHESHFFRTPAFLSSRETTMPITEPMKHIATTAQEIPVTTHEFAPIRKAASAFSPVSVTVWKNL